MKYITFKDVLQTYKSKEAGIIALSKYKHWFPLELSPRIAGIVADLMADGHLQHPPMWRMDYISASVEELQRLNKEINSLFGLSFEIRPCTTNLYGKTFMLGINSKPIGRVMSLCGVTHGSKVLTKFDIPSWITEDKECFRQFTKRLFDCEGCVDISSPGIILSMWKEESIVENGKSFFETIKNNLEKHYNIKTTNIFLGGKNNRKDGKFTLGIKLKIRKQSEIVKFLTEIGFDGKEKQEKLRKQVENIENGARGI